ncbi:carboxymuconolactone decarboxylase family protein [Rhodopirellula baltica]
MPKESKATEDATQMLAEIEAFESAYGYNADYMKDLFARSPESFRRFRAARPMTMHYDQLTAEAYFTAAITVMQQEDCSGCLELNVKMAKEAGVSEQLIEQMVKSPECLPAELKDVRDHALNCLGAGAIDEEVALRIERHFGEAAFGELAIAIVGVRIYPGLKRALMKMQSCHMPHNAAGE